MHEMEEMIETKGRALFPGLDVVSRGIARSFPPAMEIQFGLASQRRAGSGYNTHGCEKTAALELPQWSGERVEERPKGKAPQ
jgi:hypothetical protein